MVRMSSSDMRRQNDQSSAVPGCRSARPGHELRTDEKYLAAPRLSFPKVPHNARLHRQLLLWEGIMKLPHRRQLLHLAVGAAALPAVSRIARAQAYPTRP